MLLLYPWCWSWFQTMSSEEVSSTHSVGIVNVVKVFSVEIVITKYLAAEVFIVVELFEAVAIQDIGVFYAELLEVEAFCWYYSICCWAGGLYCFSNNWLNTEYFCCCCLKNLASVSDFFVVVVLTILLYCFAVWLFVRNYWKTLVSKHFCLFLVFFFSGLAVWILH